MKLFPNLSKGRYLQKRHEVAAAKRSLYYLWWRYLRLSADYWWLCQQKGKTKDKQFAATYARFGNVFGFEFDQWWGINGVELFAYKVDPPKVQLFDERAAFRSSESSDAYQLVQVPLFLNRSQIVQQVDALFAEHKAMPLPPQIKYELAVGDTRGMKRHALEAAFNVWCLNDAMQRAKQLALLDRPERYTQYWIGTKLKVMGLDEKTGYRTPKRQASDQLVMRVKVNRYLAKANAIIGNVELGQFPVVKPVPERSRWTLKQKKEMNEAIAAGQWISPESNTDEIAELLGLKTAATTSD